MERLRIQVEMLIDERRQVLGRLDHLEGKPSSTIGDDIEDHIEWAAKDLGMSGDDLRASMRKGVEAIA